MKQSENIVSIIVCTYNQERTIARALDAIVIQECEWAFEVIIGEDASQDATRKICEEYVQRYPSIVKLMPEAPNKGIVDNYYDCVRAAKGKYIMECGGDDEWCQGRMQLCLDAIEQHPDVVQVFTNVYYRKDNTSEVTEPSNAFLPVGLLKGDFVIDKMMHQRTNQHAHFAITKRESIMEVMAEYPQFFNGRKYLAEDKQLRVLLGIKGNFLNLPDRTYYYTIDTHSITRDNIMRHFIYGWNMLIMTHDLAKAINYKGCLFDTYSHILYNMCTQLVWKSIIKLFPFLHDIIHRKSLD